MLKKPTTEQTRAQRKKAQPVQSTQEEEREETIKRRKSGNW